MYEINVHLASHGLESQWGSSIPDEMILKPDCYGMILGYKVFDIRDRMLDAPNPKHVYRRLVIEARSRSVHPSSSRGWSFLHYED